MEILCKPIIFVILLCLGFILTPSTGYACAKKIDKTSKKSCSKNQYSKDYKKDCCKTKSCEKDSKHKDCSGKCKNSNCSPSVSSFAIFPQIQTKTRSYFAETSKKKFGVEITYLSAGYYHIWTPPNIS